MSWAASVERQLLLNLEEAAKTELGKGYRPKTACALHALRDFRKDQAKAEADKTEAGGVKGATVANDDTEEPENTFQVLGFVLDHLENVCHTTRMKTAISNQPRARRLAMSDSRFVVGSLVSANVVGDFRFGFRVITGHRPAVAGSVWLREVRGLPARPAGWVPLVIEWPAADCR